LFYEAKRVEIHEYDVDTVGLEDGVTKFGRERK
jgi:hypothetical protein